MMRTRPFVVLLAISTFLILFTARQHLHELGEVICTYSSFHKLVQQHPDLLYRYPESVAQTERTPKILHNIALGDADLTKYDTAIKSCRQLHPDWKHMLWRDDNAASFLSEHYPDILPHYTGYHQNIQRANIIRYALLYKLGGVYLDLDVTCHVALDSTPLVRLPLVTPGAYPAGVNNAFIAAHPDHPFLAQLLNSLPSHDLYWGLPMRIPYVENMMSTGCMFFSNEWLVYVRELLAGRQEQKVFILANEQGQTEPHMLRGKVTTPIFSHGGASSWHSWDAAMLVMIGKHYILFLVLLLFALTLAIGWPLYLCTASRRRPWRRRKCGVFSLMMSG
ncbi:glycosyltransferase family 32 protein [Ilyonectria robusta]